MSQCYERFFSGSRTGPNALWEERESRSLISPQDDQSVPSAAAYLESLNPEQRSAVEHGTTEAGGCAPLLVIAGAGSGKTNTLAHRVAHLIVGGADPRRILLMTFSRRAGAEMAGARERSAG